MATATTTRITLSASAGPSRSLLRRQACRGNASRRLHLSVLRANTTNGKASNSRQSQTPRPTQSENKGNSSAYSNVFGESSKKEKGGSHRTQYNYDPFSEQPSPEHYSFPRVDAHWLAKRKDRPRGVRMLARDFIHDALYNPHYGYFSRHAVLLPDDEQRGARLDLSKCKDEYEFTAAIEGRYKAFEDTLKAQDEEQNKKAQEIAAAQEKDSPKPMEPVLEPAPKPRSKPMPGTRESMETAQLMGKLDQARRRQSNKEAGEHDRDVKAMAARQVWHTPTELFKPHYAHALARYMLENTPRKESLKIFEVGAGSGALASDILDFIAETEPDRYSTMQYQIIEISPRLADQQCRQLARHIASGHAKIANKSVYDWNDNENDACFFIALEVFDNLTHDVVRYATDTLKPYQAVVSIDSTGDMHELWEPVHDERIKRYFELASGADQKTKKMPPSAPAHFGWTPSFLRKAMARHLPLYPNLTPPHYVPTGSIALMDVLAKHFPKHRMVMSDFDRLPDALVGHNAPVVQTRLQGTMVPVTQYLVHQGFFDIFFPTDFAELRRIHGGIMKQQGESGRKDDNGKVVPHGTFLRQYGDLAATTCADGSNPMLSWYANASWYLS